MPNLYWTENEGVVSETGNTIENAVDSITTIVLWRIKLEKATVPTTIRIVIDHRPEFTQLWRYYVVLIENGTQTDRTYIKHEEIEFCVKNFNFKETHKDKNFFFIELRTELQLHNVKSSSFMVTLFAGAKKIEATVNYKPLPLTRLTVKNNELDQERLALLIENIINEFLNTNTSYEIDEFSREKLLF